MRKISFAIFSGALLLGVVASTGVCAQAYPSRPIRFIVPFAPGGSTDTLARTLGTKLTEALGQQVVVDNRAGGNGNIGTDVVAHAVPDGYTILLGYIANLAIGPSLYAKLPYDPVKDFAPITLLAVAPNILVVHPSVPARNFQEFIAYAKANPTKVNFASAAVASPGHLSGELLNLAAGIHMQHVPYKGAGQAARRRRPRGQRVLGARGARLPFPRCLPSRNLVSPISKRPRGMACSRPPGLHQPSSRD